MSLMTISEKKILERIKGPLEEGCGTGRSTRLGLEILSRCYTQPGVWFPLCDHRNTKEADMELTRLVAGMITKLKFEHFEFRKNKEDGSPHIRILPLGERI